MAHILLEALRHLSPHRLLEFVYTSSLSPIEALLQEYAGLLLQRILEQMACCSLGTSVVLRLKV